MSLQAVGWLSSKLGINIGGRTDSGDVENRNTSGGGINNVASAGTVFDSYLHKLNEVVFGPDEPVGGTGATGGGGMGGVLMNLDGNASGGASTRAAQEDEVELDENGLPVTKNWYYFDKELNRWNVSPNAPEKIKQEHQRRLQEEEDERNGLRVAPPPPPPMHAPLRRASDGGAPNAPGTASHPQGLFSAHGQAGAAHGGTLTQRTTGPQYAMPTYFQTTDSVPPPPQNLHAPHASYGDAHPMQYESPQESPYSSLHFNQRQPQQPQQQQPQQPFPQYTGESHLTQHHQQQQPQMQSQLHSLPQQPQQQPAQHQSFPPLPTNALAGGSYPPVSQQPHGYPRPPYQTSLSSYNNNKGLS